MNERINMGDKKPEITNTFTQIRRKNEISRSMISPFDKVLFLQRSIGNQAVLRLMKSGALRAKLRIGQPGDVYEQEADRVAEQLIRMPEQKKSPFSEDEMQRQPDMEEEILQSRQVPGFAPEVTPELESQISAIRSGGQPLPESTRAFFEPRFGRDFSSVRVHTDAMAKESTRAVNARAFTVGKDIVFGEFESPSETSEGKRLLAHELTHVVQQDKRRDGYLNRKPDSSIWGGFRIIGTRDFINRVRNDLNTLNGTSQGRSLLSAITSNRSPFYRSLIRIQSGACGFIGNIYYNASGCGVPDNCGGTSNWTSVPNYVYLFHEIVHAYLYYIANRGTHRDRECMATGLGSYFTSIPYNENRLRCELGFPIRPCYDGECTRFPSPTCPQMDKTEKTPSGKILPLIQRQVKGETKKEPAISGCAQEKKDFIKKGITGAKKSATKALSVLNKMIPLSYEEKAITSNFGRISSKQKDSIISRYKHIESNLDSKEIKCVQKCKKKSGFNLCAQGVTPGNKIFICPNFGTKGCEPESTILHESAHNAGAKDDIDKSDKYPPKNAENNAYSYEYFVIDVKKGLPDISLPPKREIEISIPEK